MATMSVSVSSVSFLASFCFFVLFCFVFGVVVVVVFFFFPDKTIKDVKADFSFA